MIQLRFAAPFVVVCSSIFAAPPAWSAQVAYYQLPSGAYPHDVAPAPDGTVWFTGQSQGFLGRFDPRNGFPFMLKAFIEVRRRIKDERPGERSPAPQA